MYGIFTYIWVIYGVNVGKYTIHGASGIYIKGMPEENMWKRYKILWTFLVASKEYLAISGVVQHPFAICRTVTTDSRP